MSSRDPLQKKKIQIKYCLNKRDSIQVYSLGKERYRAITKMLDEGNHEYHTFKLPEERTLRVVLRGIPQIASIEDVHQNLMTCDSV